MKNKFFKLWYLIIAILCLSFVSCKKDDNTPITPVVPTGYQQYGTPFADIPSNEDIVMYEVNLRAFSSTGNLKGVTNKLDHLKSLGVNVIWLMPIYPDGEVNSVNSPYCIKNFKAVATEYGNLADLRALTDAAHSKGMAVILDWVANHTSWDNAWITNKSWYTQDGSGNIIHPPGTNWMDVADLDFSNTKMKAAMIDAMKYWVLEANTDGFRCDYADGVPFSFWKQAIDTLRAIPERRIVMLAEGDRSDHFSAGFDLHFSWSFYGAMKSVFDGQTAGKLYDTHETEYASVPAGKQTLRFTTNHDESAWDATPMTLFDGEQGATAASVITVFMGGVPLLYTGQEVGRTATVPFFSNSTIDWTAHATMLASYQKIMNIYTNSLAARKGTITDYSVTDVSAFVREYMGEELFVIVNCRQNDVTYSLPADIQNTAWTNSMDQSETNLGTEVLLGSREFLILSRLKLK
jgi:glycosidase